jgi:hypothetical protein
MTPEELNRTIEFIVASQARLAAGQEQDRQDRVEFQEWSKRMMAWVVELTNHQSQRMDRLDKIYAESTQENRTFMTESRDFYQESRDFQKQSLEFENESIELQRETRRLLNLLRDGLASAPPSSG